MKSYVNPTVMLIELKNKDILTLSEGSNGNASLIDYDEFFPTNQG